MHYQIYTPNIVHNCIVTLNAVTKKYWLLSLLVCQYIFLEFLNSKYSLKCNVLLLKTPTLEETLSKQVKHIFKNLDSF